MIDLAYLAWVLVNLLFIPLSGWIAERRGRSIKFWCWMGFISGPIAPLVLALLPQRGHPPGSELNGDAPWFQTRGRASGERGEPHSRTIVVCATP
jgi:MFS family permease